MNYTNLKEALQRKIAFYECRRDRAKTYKDGLRKNSKDWHYYDGIQTAYSIVVVELSLILEAVERS